MSIQQANSTSMILPVSVIHDSIEPITIKNRVFDATTDIGNYN